MSARPSADVITIDQLRLDCIVGLLPHERTTEQPLVVRLELELDTTKAGLSGQLSATVDYAEVARGALFILRAGRFKLLETAGLALCHYLLSTPVDKDVAVSTSGVTLTKPNALGGLGVPSLSLRRRADQAGLAGGDQGSGQLRIFACGEVAILKLTKGASVKGAALTGSYSRQETLALSDSTQLMVMSL